jgi:hypothetical protein
LEVLSVAEQASDSNLKGGAAGNDTIFLVLLIASQASLALSLYASGSVFLLCSFGGWVITLVALCGSLKRLTAHQCKKASGWGGLALLVLLLIAHTQVAIKAQRRVSSVVDQQPVVVRSLKSLGDTIREYAEKNRNYPESLSQLLLAHGGPVHPKNLISSADSGCEYSFSYNDWPPNLAYSSFIYLPGEGAWTQDQRVVLAYEYDAWHPLEVELFPERGRFVLFGDLHVKLLDPISFSRALRDDDSRRREMNWPQQMSRSVGDIPATRPGPSWHGTK